MTTALETTTGNKALAAATTNSPVLGIEGMDDRDGVLPRIQLLQDKAVLLKNLHKAKIQAIAGQLLNTSDENKPLDSVTFIPAYMTKFWDVYEIGATKDKWLARTFVENDPQYADRRWTYKKDEQGKLLKPEVRQVISVVALVDGSPAVINFKGGSKKTGQELYQKARNLARTAQKPLWAYKYVLASKEIPGDNPYYAFTIAQGSETTPEEQELAHSLFVGFAGKNQKLNAAAGAETDETSEETPF